MSPELETALVQKVDQIHAALVGPFNQEEEGLLYRVRNHDKRISSLERWRWYVVGCVMAVIGLLKLLFKAI